MNKNKAKLPKTNIILAARGLVSAVCGRGWLTAAGLPFTAHTGSCCRLLSQQHTAAMDPIAQAQAAVTKQGDTVRSLKAELKEGKITDKVRAVECVCVCVCIHTGAHARAARLLAWECGPALLRSTDTVLNTHARAGRR